ncbi:MAG: lysophospholipid acyltransferase family protein [Bacillota bacterium]
MKNLILYLIYRIFTLLVLIFPTSLKKSLGRGFGKLAYKITPGRRQIAAENIKRALPAKSQKEIDKMVKAVYDNLGKVMVEFILLKKLDKNNLKNLVEIEGENHLKRAANSEEGVIIYSAHFGNWEWLASILALKGYKLSAIAQEQSNKLFNKKVNQIRKEKGIEIIPKGVSVRNVYKKLKDGECVFILGDQNAGKKGWKMQFFNLDTSAYNGAVKLAQKTGARIVPAFIARKGWLNFKITIHPSLQVNKSADNKKLKGILQELLSITENTIKENPEQWFWLHRRWKTYH